MNDMRLGPALLSARGCLFGLVSTALTAVAHELGGGRTPSGWVLLGAAVAAAEVGLLAGQVERRLLQVLAALAATQLGMHLLFTATSPGVRSEVHPVGHAGSAPSSIWMALAHALATLAVAWWLRRGEAALWQLLRAVGLRVAPVLTAAAAVQMMPANRTAPAGGPLWTPRQRAGRPGEVCRRGPPTTTAAPAR